MGNAPAALLERFDVDVDQTQIDVTGALAGK